jgi:hypothetical protein
MDGCCTFFVGLGGQSGRPYVYVVEKWSQQAWRPYCLLLGMRQDDLIKLQTFVDTSKSRGAGDEFLAALLTRRGWTTGEVYAVLGKHWESSTGLAIPERAGATESARDAFLYLLSFATLATWTGAFGSMLFQFIDYWFPDSVSRSYVYDLRSAVTWQMAALAVAFPIYLLAMRTILREAGAQPERLESGVRKWLTYLALLGTAGAMICDLICFLDYFLAGELTVRFVLKAAAVMAICGSVFAYYIGSLRWDRSTDMERAQSRSTLFAICSTVALAAAFLIGLGVAGTPSQQRRIEADKKRVEDLRNLAFAIKRRNEQDAQAELPSALSELKLPKARLSDPETKAPYEYRRGSGSGYELCATFDSESDADNARNGLVSNRWAHGKGRSCFAIDMSKPVPY